MSLSKQQGSAHIIVMATLIIALLAAIGFMAWQNIGPGRQQVTQKNTGTQSPLPSASAGSPYEPTDLTANTTPDQANIWAGYIASATEFKEVEGRVKIPEITCTNSEQTFGAWVGFDGWNGSQTVEQAGITATCDDASAYAKAPPINGVYYYAWAAMHGAGNYEDFDFPVKPGDVIYSKASYADGQFTLTVKNETTGKSGTNTQRCVMSAADQQVSAAPNCPRTQAEWIVERPGSNGMAGFGKVTLYDNTATTMSGTKTYIEGFANSRRNMVQGTTVLAETAPLVGKGAFDVNWVAHGKSGD